MNKLRNSQSLNLVFLRASDIKRCKSRHEEMKLLEIHHVDSGLMKLTFGCPDHLRPVVIPMNFRIFKWFLCCKV